MGSNQFRIFSKKPDDIHIGGGGTQLPDAAEKFSVQQTVEYD